MVAGPLTSRVVAGVVVLTPILAVAPDPVWTRAELPRLVALVQRGTKFGVPAPVTVAGGSAGVGPAAGCDEVDPGEFTGAASMKAEGGSPPIVSASPAFKA